ncbi:MAG: glycosyltransferase family 2 protein [Chloroflexota bacterium]
MIRADADRDETKHSQRPQGQAGSATKSVCIILPALNEEGTVGQVIDEVPVDELRQSGYTVEIVVVDDGSDDATAEVARQRGARVITEAERGKGRAVRRALDGVCADYLVMLDADFTYPCSYIPTMLRKLDEGFDVVEGSRLKGTRAPGSISKFNMLGNHLLTAAAVFLYGVRTSDLCTGYWAFKGEVPRGLDLRANGFTLEAELYTRIAKKGLRLGEIPIHYRRRPTPTKLRVVRDGFRIGWTLVKNRFV